jgi:hypothetical protein
MFHMLLTYLRSREYELMTEANTKLSVVGNCSRSYLCVRLGGGETAGGLGVVSSSRGWGRQTVHKSGAV